ncbi:autotransporter domain-containing protein [uncultured Brevundimonas sp.]|uniref:autotransporter outer membrane beta-barrel domain-containing protein n=1 Tax=uncultured Brevundimonas sp. TaxID=213418 RepID=UPI0030EEECB1|tara:strand:+ start:953 stop:4306 length:3354 start_codon:yes stop_codon:yes gene_type:complete
MSSINSRESFGARTSSFVIDSRASGLIRTGLLGGTALVAAGLVATGAMAQTYVVGGSPVVLSGGGTVIVNADITAITHALELTGAFAIEVRTGVQIKANQQALRLIGSGSSATNFGAITSLVNGSIPILFLTPDSVNNRVINEVGASVVSSNGTVISSRGVLTLINAGSITSVTSTSALPPAVVADGALTLTNNTGGTISGAQGVLALGVGTVTNAVGATITSSLLPAVYLTGSGSVLDNAGSISVNPGSASAVQFSGSGTVVNRTGGTISSARGNGLRMDGPGASVTNAGSIEGGTIGVLLLGTNAVLNNSGTVSGGLNGVRLDGGTSTITNQSGGVIGLMPSSGMSTAILLTGAGYTLNLEAGSTVNGMIDASTTTGLNTVTIGGTVTGTYSGGSGSDAVTLLGGATVAALLGGAGDDSLSLSGLADGTLNIGLVSGFESRTMNGDGTWTLSGVDAEAVDWTLNSGTLRLTGGQSVSDSAGIRVNTGAALSVGASETIGALNGTGNVAISSGSLTFGGVTSVFSGTLSGGGSLVHTSDLFSLSGNHTLQSLSNTGGELRFVGTTTGDVAVTGGSLTGTATIGGALTVSNGATLSPGVVGQASSIGRLSAGSLTLNGGTLSLGVLGTAGGNLSDTLVISGTANLTGGLIAPTFLAPAGGYDFVTHYTFLTAGQLVGTFGNGVEFTAATGQTGMYWRVVYDRTPNAAVLELRKLTDFTLEVDGSGNQKAVGQALSSGQLEASGDWAGVLDLLSGLNGTQQQAAFDNLGGEALADVSTSMFAANDAFLGAVRDGSATHTPGSAPLSFASAFSFVGGRDGAAAMVTGVLDAFDPSAEAGTGRGGWISVHASDIDLEGKAGQADLQTRLNGFVGGYAVGTGDYVLGAAAGATRVEGNVAERQSSFESDLIHAAGYVRFDNGRWAADLTASAYGGEIDSRRTVTVGAFTGQATGQTHGEGQSVSLSVARRIANERGGAVSVGLMETISRSTINGFTERAAGGLSLEVANQERNWQTTQLNLRGTQDYRLSGGQPMRLYGGIGALVTTGDREAAADMRFSGAGTGFGGFVIKGAEAPPLAGVAEFGMEYQARKGLTLSAGYRGVVSARLRDNQFGARLSVQW